MTPTIDLRSDTVTLPSPEMRRAMYEAELGDDVWGDDPTVNSLQDYTAALLGTEAALFVPSGTMGNLVAVLAHTRRGDAVVMGDESHMYHYEGGGASVLGATAMRAVPTLPDGMLPLEALRAAVRDPGDVHQARPGLLCLENTHNRRGGAVLPLDYMVQARAVAREAGLPIHLDGARLFNAAVYLGVPARDIVRHVDSVNVCFSKGLAAPVGSILCGQAGFIDEARRWRKMVGGGMRQAGVLAAAALYALHHMVERLANDHANARHLAEALSALPGLCLAQPSVQTNIVYIEVGETGLSADAFVERLREEGVLAGATGPTTVRFVTHYGIELAAIEDAVGRIERALARDHAVIGA